jgi:hypothetical protein
MFFIESILGIKGHMVANQYFKYVWVDNNTKWTTALPKMYASLPRVQNIIGTPAKTILETKTERN